MIRCKVGDELRLIDDDVFIDAHAQLSQFYVSLGLDGDLLDIQIAKELPHRLAAMLDSNAK
jgi:hypothetical protein